MGHPANPLPIFADESIQRLKDVAGLKGAFTGICSAMTDMASME